jgi:hypothetical protein
MRDIVFGLSLNYDDGVQTSVAINNNGKLVEVHKSQGAQTLWYHTGQSRQMDVSWSGSHQYDDGITPSVALNDHDLVVEVHKAQFWDKLWYHVGRINGDKVNWSSGHEYDSGVLPSVALDNDNWCVEVHKSQGISGLWYHVGQVNQDTKTIDWGSSYKYDTGYTPKIAMNNKGVIVEVHKSEWQDTLWYHVGIIDKKNKTINWGPSLKYDDGVQPSVAITDDGFVIEVHKSQAWGTLWRNVGTVDIDRKVINWSPNEQYDTGQAPSVAVALNGSVAVQTHQSELDTTLWFSTSLVIDRMLWMEQQYNTLRTKPLWQVTLPGSHDSGAYDMGTDRAPCHDAPDWVPGTVVRLFATAHNLNMAGQLQNGARYFDLRPYYKDGTFYAYHDVLGANFENILNDVAWFLQHTKRELVILKISHFCNFDDYMHQQLVNLITQKLGTYLFKNMSANLLTTTIEEFVGLGSKVIIWYDDSYITNHPTDGFWKNFSIYDSYAETDSYSIMEGDQLHKMKTNPGSSTKLFLLSWTLTFKDWKSPAKGLSLQAIAAAANRNLGRFLAENANRYQTNVLYVDFQRDARVTDCAIMLNR